MKMATFLVMISSVIGLSAGAQISQKSPQRTLIAYMKVVPGTQGRFLQSAQNVIIKSRREPGNLIYILQQSSKEPNQFVFYEVFRTDADLEYHRNSPHVRAFLEETKPILLPGKFTLEKYENLMTIN